MNMKEIPLISTCIAMGIMTAAPTTGFAIDPQQSDFTNDMMGKDTMLLNQADTGGSKKASVGKQHAKGTKLNVDQKGVILKGYDAVAYFKQGKAVKGNPSITSVYKGATYYFASNSDKADFDKSP